jgi:hypothetical protein
MILALVSFRTIAQDSLIYWNKVEQYRKLQKGGALATFLGVGSAGIGLALMVDNFWDQGTPYMLGLGMFIIGTASTLVGIPVWIVGSTRKNKAQKNLDQITLGITTGRGSPGVSLVYKF